MTHITISFDADPSFGVDVLTAIDAEGFEAYQRPGRVRGDIPITDIVVSLGTAGAFTAIKDVISGIMGKHTQKSIYVKFKGTEIKLEGFSQKEELEMLDKLLASANPPKHK